MTAPMFARTTEGGHECRLCARAGRTGPTGRPACTERLYMRDGHHIDICAVCDQNPADAPAHSRGGQ